MEGSPAPRSKRPLPGYRRSGAILAKKRDHSMRNILLGLSAVSLLAVASPALADDAAPASDFTVTGGATVVSDYRFRGISQTFKRFAVQGTAGISHSSGFYIGTWGSTIDDYVANGGDAEIDLYGGYKKSFGGATVDVGVLYYYYPGSSENSANYKSDFFEPYASISGTVGPVSAKLGAAYAPKQHALAVLHSRDDSLYAYGELSGAIPGTGVSVTGHLGRSFERSVETFGQKYTDWSVAATYAWKGLTFGVSYVDTNKNLPVTSPGGTTRNIERGGVVGSVGVSF